MNNTARPLLQPEFVISTLEKLEDLLPELKKKKIALLILDVDQTLYLGKEKTISHQGLHVIKEAKAQGFQLVAASNNFCIHRKELEKLDLDGLYAFCLKPLPFLFWRLKRKFGLQTCEMAICGDQRLTDIAAGNLAGAATILNIAPKKEMRLDQKLIHYIETKLTSRHETGVLRFVLKVKK